MQIMKKYIFWGCLLLVIILGNCKKPYNPGVINAPNSYFVVEGVINNGNDSTIVKLSKTVNISSSTKTSGVDNCAVQVEGEQGSTYQLVPQGNGYYVLTELNLDISKKYRLHITTGDGTEYASDYVEVKTTPPIDSIGFAVKNNQLQIYANTHDATNNSRYYRWAYEETWRFHAKYQSSFIVDQARQEVVIRPPSEQSYYCFAGDKSSSIVLGSSAKLSQDVIFQQPITTIAAQSEKIELRYTIKLKQYTLTKEAYQFWESLRKNTEQLGSIFDAQPSQLTGNVHNLKNAAEPVIGYVSITNIQTKRVFIDNADVPQDWLTAYPYECGQPDSALFSNPKTMANDVQNFIIRGGSIPISEITDHNSLIGYTYSSAECSDCRIRGHVATPPFWINKK